MCASFAKPSLKEKPIILVFGERPPACKLMIWEIRCCFGNPHNMWTASRNLYPDGVFWPKVNSRWTSFWSKLFLTVLATSVEWHFDDFWAKSHTQELQTNKVHKRIERPTIGEEKQFHTRVLKPWSYPSKRTGWQQGQTRATTSESAILGSNRFHCSVKFPLQQRLSMVSMWSPRFQT